jgi:hypothetical protein
MGGTGGWILGGHQNDFRREAACASGGIGTLNFRGDTSTTVSFVVGTARE